MHFAKNPVNLPFEIYKNIFKDTNLRDVQLCGNKGDAIFHPEFNKIIDYTIDQGVFISVSTNGSAFSEKWWKDLGQRMKGEVTFALDGLEDTHKVYRDTSFTKVFKNMIAFIEGGGRARWQFIVFKHNEHQLKEAKDLSKRIGCHDFITVISRFYDDVMQRPTDTGRNTKRELHTQVSKHPNLKKLILGEVRCRWKEMKRVYVSSRGFVYACCYLCCHLNDWHTHPEFLLIKNNMKQPEYNIANNTLNEIVKLPWFTNIYDNVQNFEMCDLHCTNLETYNNKIRKEEKL
jgi:MoaA/NifB/PqqE/SkfB family radical SAM enzyme